MEEAHSHTHSPGPLHRHDSWTCPRCGWVYPNPHPSAKHRRNHKKHCGKVKGFELSSIPHDGGSSDDASSDEENHLKTKIDHEASGTHVMSQEERDISPLMDSGAAHGKVETNTPTKQDPTLGCQSLKSSPQSNSSDQSISVSPSVEATSACMEEEETKMLAQQDNAEPLSKSKERTTEKIGGFVGEDLREEHEQTSSVEDTGSNAGDFQSGTFSESENQKYIQSSRDGVFEVEHSMEGCTSIEKSGGDLDISAEGLKEGVGNNAPLLLSTVEEQGDTKMFSEQDNADSGLKSEDISTANMDAKLNEEERLVSSDKETGNAAAAFQPDTSSGPWLSLRDETLPMENDNGTHPVLEGSGADKDISGKGLETGEKTFSASHVAEQDISHDEVVGNISSSHDPSSENLEEKNVDIEDDPTLNSISSGLEVKDFVQDDETGGELCAAKSVEHPKGAPSEQMFNLSEKMANNTKCLPSKETEIGSIEKNFEKAEQPENPVSHSDEIAAIEKSSTFEGPSAVIEGTQMLCEIPAEVKDMDEAGDGDVCPDLRTEVISPKPQKHDNAIVERPSVKTGEPCQWALSGGELPMEEKIQIEDSQDFESSAPCCAEAGIDKKVDLQKALSSDLYAGCLEKGNVTETTPLSSQDMGTVNGQDEAGQSGKTAVSGRISLHSTESKGGLNTNDLVSRGLLEGSSLKSEGKAIAEDDSVYVGSPNVLGESHPGHLPVHAMEKEKSADCSVLPSLEAETMKPKYENPDTEQMQEHFDKFSENMLQEKNVSEAHSSKATTEDENFQEDSSTKNSAPNVGDSGKEPDTAMLILTQKSCEVPNDVQSNLIVSGQERERVLETGCMSLGGIKAVFSERSDSLETETYEDAPDSFETGSVGGNFDENEMLDDSRQITDGRLEGQKLSTHQAAALPDEKASKNCVEIKDKPGGSSDLSSSEVVREKKEDTLPKENNVGTSTTQDLKAPSPEAWQEHGPSDVGTEDNEARAEQLVQPVPKSSRTEVREHQISEKEHIPLRSLLAKEGSEKFDQNHTTSQKGEEKNFEDDWGSHNDQKPKTRSIWSHCICCPVVH